MAFNIWERWPWTSFQNLNLEWLMKAVMEAITKADEAASSVGQFDARITTNTKAIGQLSDDVETISSPVRVIVSTELEARYRGNLVTGAQLLEKIRTHGDLPYVEYNGEVYMLDTPSTSGDLRFSMAHTTLLGDVTLRHITIPAQSSSAMYSVTNVGGGSGSSGNVFAVTVREQGGEYVADHTYAEIYSQMQDGRIPVLLVGLGSNPTTYQICGMGATGTYTINGQSVACIRFSDPTWLTSNTYNVGVWIIDANNSVDHIASLKQIAALQNVVDLVNDGVSTNALLKTAQTLTAAEQAQVKQNLGISGTGGGTEPRVPISASSPTIPPLSPNTLYVFTGDATALNIQLTAPSDSNIANEYHFIFNSGATPTTLSVPSGIHWPDGFAVEANHVYEVSILENNMTAQGWAVSA